MHTNLPEVVRALLLERRGEWPVVAKQAKVSHSWISKFVNGHIPNPGYATLSRLHENMPSIEKQAPAHAQQAPVAMGLIVQKETAPVLMDAISAAGEGACA